MKGFTDEWLKSYEERTAMTIITGLTPNPRTRYGTGWSYIIGIDCGVNTGFAVWMRPVKEFRIISSGTITAAMRKIMLLKNDGIPIFVRFEDARLRKIIPRMPNESRERGRREGAGSVKRDAKVWEDWLQEEGIPYEAVAPKDNMTKLSAATFMRTTGWGESTNEHERDAAMLVFGL
jgi:predicted RNase H-like nuclease (RuvC/YqgF family)